MIDQRHKHRGKRTREPPITLPERVARPPPQDNDDIIQQWVID